MKPAVSLLMGVIIGVVVTVVTVWVYAPGLMVRESESPYGVEKTVEMIKNNARNAG